MRAPAKAAAAAEGAARGPGANVDQCVVCGEGGRLLCCDGCPASYHAKCFDPPLSAQQLPKGAWYCPDCEDDYKRIPVWRPGQSGVLRGDRAPLKKELAAWLRANPGYQVWKASSVLA